MKRERIRRGFQRPTLLPLLSLSPSSAGQGVAGHSLSGIWANETRTVHVHQYIDPAHRPRRGFVLVCARQYTVEVQRVNITRGGKTGWRPCLVAEIRGGILSARAWTFCSIEWPRFRDTRSPLGRGLTRLIRPTCLQAEKLDYLGTNAGIFVDFCSW